MAAGSIKIGPEFFAGVFRDYADWRFALARELFQNSVDADGTDRIEVTIAPEPPGTRLIWRNNGAPMSREILVNKFLTLGASGKQCQNGKTGGFGAAKLLIAYCHQHYAIRTGTLHVTGSGADYDLQDCTDDFHGTETSILVKGDEIDNLVRACRQVAFCAQWDGEFVLNGELLETNLRKGSRRTEFDWGVVYTNKSMEGKLLARVNGLPMFLKPISYAKGMVLVELSGASTDVLTSNRDGLIYKYQCELDEFIAKIAVDTRSAFRDRKKDVEREKHEGYLLAGITAEPRKGTFEPEEMGMDLKEVLAARVTTNMSGGGGSTSLTTETIQNLLHPTFHIYNEIGGKIPNWFRAGNFSENSRRLISKWTLFLVELAVTMGSTKPFAVGFIFSNEILGAHEVHGGEHVLYVNPAILVEKDGKPRQLKTRWSFDTAGHYELLVLACHEFAHFHTGIGTHDEDFSAFCDTLFAKVMLNRTSFTRHFSVAPFWPC